MVGRLLLIVSLLGSVDGMAQCVPNQAYQDSVFGVWPDTTENFLPGYVGQAYSDTLYVLIPADAGDIIPMYAGLMIDSVAFIGLSGLPPGITVQCNSQTPGPCTFLTGQVGCGLLTGVPTTGGNYSLTVNVIGYAAAPFGAVQIPYSFEGYSILVSDQTGTPTITASVVPGPSSARNVPNPFSQRTSIEFELGRAGNARVQVFDLVGAELWSELVQGRAGLNRVPFDASRMESGIYLYKVTAAGRTITGRMVLNR